MNASLTRRPSHLLPDLSSSNAHKPPATHAFAASKENSPAMTRSPDTDTPLSATSGLKRKRAVSTLSVTQDSSDPSSLAGSSSSTKTKKAKVSDDEDNAANAHQAPEIRKSRSAMNGKTSPGMSEHAQTKVPRKSNGQTKGKDLDASNATEDFPNGFFYCHQCGKKRDADIGLQCTYVLPNSSQSERCKAKYCKACLRNRYGQDVDEIHSKGEEAAPRRKGKGGHISGCGYVFRCPKCEGTCNCCRCRKAQGLEPVGNMTRVARKVGADSVAAVLHDNPAATGILPGKGHQVVPEEKPKASRKTKGEQADKKPNDKVTGPVASTPTTASEEKKPRRTKVVPKTTPLPDPLWTKVDTALSLPEAEMRMHIREFVLRFSDLMMCNTRSVLEELEVVDSDGVGGDDGEIVGWVSEACVKTILLGLLEIFQDDKASPVPADVLSVVLKDLQSSSANLNKMWTALLKLRSLAFRLPDPLPPPAFAAVRSTRSGGGDSTVIASPAQLVPIVALLVESAMLTEKVRDELGEGLKESEEIVKEARDRRNKEKTRWDAVPKGNGQSQEIRVQKAAHAEKMEDIDRSLNLLQSAAYILRFAPLGRDVDGRVYYTLTPGLAERDAALECVKGEGRGGKRRRLTPRVISERDRKEMGKWSWAVMVWGRMPEGAVKLTKDEEADEVGNGESWWGFWEPEQVRRLADYVARTGGLTEEDEETSSTHASTNGTKARPSNASSLSGYSAFEDDRTSELSDLSADIDMDMSQPGRGELRVLAQGLIEYADVLKWRVRKWGEESGKKVL